MNNQLFTAILKIVLILYGIRKKKSLKMADRCARNDLFFLRAGKAYGAAVFLMSCIANRSRQLCRVRPPSSWGTLTSNRPPPLPPLPPSQNQVPLLL